MPLEDALEHRLAEVRHKAEMRQEFDRYPLMTTREKLAFAFDILQDACEDWDNDSVVFYPKDLPSFDEYVSELRSKVFEIEWK